MRPELSLAWRGRCLALWIALVPAATCGAGSRDALLTSGQKLYSQHNEELVIRHFFEDRKDGFFVDVGAFVPIQTSTTYYLEKHLGRASPSTRWRCSSLFGRWRGLGRAFSRTS